MHRHARRQWLKAENEKLTRQARKAGLEGEIDVDEADVAVEPVADIDDDDGTTEMRLAAARRALKHAKQDAVSDAQQAAAGADDGAQPLSRAARRRQRKRQRTGIAADDAEDAKVDERLAKKRVEKVRRGADKGDEWSGTETRAPPDALTDRHALCQPVNRALCRRSRSSCAQKWRGRWRVPVGAVS
jgi:hypothetical protein